MPGLRTEDITSDVGFKNASIANGQSLSDAIDLLASRASAIYLPATLTVADLTFQVSYDGITFSDYYDADGEVKIPSAVVAVSRAIAVDLPLFFGVRYLKIRTGTAAAPIAQGGARTLVIATIPR